MRTNVNLAGLPSEAHLPTLLKKTTIDCLGKLVIGGCSPLPFLRPLFAKAGITPANFGNRAVRIPIPNSSKTLLMSGADKNCLTYRLFWSGTNYYEPFTRT